MADTIPELSPDAFKKLQRLADTVLGISLQENKKDLIRNKLLKRLHAKQCCSFDDYFDKALHSPDEKEVLLNLLTVNETSFFREPNHFEFIKTILHQWKNRQLSCWSAAASNGAEAYSLAMLLDEQLRWNQTHWEILASDINAEILHAARRAVYPLHLADKIPANYRQRYCLKGMEGSEGLFMIDEALKERIRFLRHNLLHPLQTPKQYDLIFLRNVLFYYETEKRKQILHNILKHLRPGGYLLVGHSEHLDSAAFGLTTVQTTIYQKERAK